MELLLISGSVHGTDILAERAGLVERAAVWLDQKLNSNTERRAKSALKPVLIGIYVKNYDTSVAWYRDNLGFRVTKEVVNDNVNLKIGFLDNGSFELEVYADISPDTTGVRLARDNFGMPNEGFTKLTLATDDLVVLNTELKKNGVEFVVETRPSDRRPAMNWFMIQDPDGNLIQVLGSAKP